MKDFETTITISTSNEDTTKAKAKVVKNMLKNIDDATFVKLAEKIKEDKTFFQQLTPYLSML